MEFGPFPLIPDVGDQTSTFDQRRRCLDRTNTNPNLSSYLSDSGRSSGFPLMPTKRIAKDPMQKLEIATADVFGYLDNRIRHERKVSIKYRTPSPTRR